MMKAFILVALTGLRAVAVIGEEISVKQSIARKISASLEEQNKMQELSVGKDDIKYKAHGAPDRHPTNDPGPVAGAPCDNLSAGSKDQVAQQCLDYCLNSATNSNDCGSMWVYDNGRCCPKQALPAGSAMDRIIPGGQYYDTYPDGYDGERIRCRARCLKKAPCLNAIADNADSLDLKSLLNDCLALLLTTTCNTWGGALSNSECADCLMAANCVAAANRKCANTCDGGARTGRNEWCQPQVEWLGLCGEETWWS